MKHLLCSAMLIVPSLVWAGPSLCQPSEAVVFACPTKGGQWVSVCSGDAGLSYRFGTKQKTELELADPGIAHPDAFRHYHYFRAGVDRTWLTMQTPTAVYEVFSEYEAPSQPTAGVRVFDQSGRQLANRLCVGQAEAHWYRLEGKVACSDEAVNSCVPPVPLKQRP